MKPTRSISVLILEFILKTSFAKIKPVIIDGDYASIKMYPHSAYLEIKTTNKSGIVSGYGCGASILNQDILLTAGHCIAVTSRDITKVQVTAIVGHGNVILGTTKDVTGRQIRSVSSFKVHEYYSSSPLLNDIALLKLKNRLTFSETVRRVAIMKSPPYYGPASVAGWGATDFNNTQTTHALKHARGLEIWSREECLDRYDVPPIESDITLPRGFICVGKSFYPNGIAYHGDSGGALVVRDYVQIGIVSYSYPIIYNITDPKEQHYFGRLQVYTDVRYYYDWILKNVQKLYCKNNRSSRIDFRKQSSASDKQEIIEELQEAVF